MYTYIYICIIWLFFIFHNVWENPNPTDELIFFKMLIAPPTSNVAPPWGLGPQRQAPVIRRLISPSQVGVPIFFFGEITEKSVSETQNVDI